MIYVVKSKFTTPKTECNGQARKKRHSFDNPVAGGVENGRRITAEINIRLRESLKTSFTPGAPGASYAPALAVLPSRHGPPTPAATAETPAREDAPPYAAFDDLDRAMLEVFRSMTVQKKLALLSLLQ